MTPRTIFTFILKIIGLYMIFELAEIIPLLFGQSLSFFNMGSDISSIIFITVTNLIVFLIYFILMRLLLFKSGWIIDKLSLDKNFDQEIVSIKVDTTAVIQIASIVLRRSYFC